MKPERDTPAAAPPSPRARCAHDAHCLCVECVPPAFDLRSALDTRVAPARPHRQVSAFERSLPWHLNEPRA